MVQLNLTFVFDVFKETGLLNVETKNCEHIFVQPPMCYVIAYKSLHQCFRMDEKRLLNFNKIATYPKAH